MNVGLAAVVARARYASEVLPAVGATRVSLLATEEEIASWNTRKTLGPFAVSDDFGNGNATDAANFGEYTAMAAAFGTTWSASHWAGPTTLDGTYIAASSANDPTSGARAQAFDMLGASYKCLMDDRASAGSGDVEAAAIIAEIEDYATQANLDYGNATLWPQLSSGYYEDLNPLFYHCLWVSRMVLAYSNCAALVGTNATIEGWFSDLAYLAEHELHVSLSKPWPNRKSDDYVTGRWASNGFDGDTSFDVWGDEADGTDVNAMTIQRWLSNRRVEQAALVLMVGALLDDTVLIAEGERFLREWMGFGINVTTGSHPDYNRDSQSASIPQLGLDYQWKSWRAMMAAIDAAYRKGYTTAKTQTTSIGSTHATWGTQKDGKTLEECIAVLASWVDESITTQVYTPANSGYEGLADYRRCPATPGDTIWYSDGWLVRAAAMFDRSDWRNAARRVGTPEGFYASIQNDGGMTGTRIGHWERFLDPWDDRAAVYAQESLLGLWQAAVAGVGSDPATPSDLLPLGPFTTADIYVDPNALTNGTGTLASPFDNIEDALAAVTDGQVIGVYAGTLNLAARLVRSTSWATGIQVVALNGGRVTLNFNSAATGSASRVLTLSGANELWHGFDITGWNVDGAAVYVDGDSYDLSAIRASHGNGDGIYLYQATDTKLRDIAVYRIGDGVTTGTNAPDCLVLTGSTSVLTTGTRMARVFVANGPDDGIDGYRARGTRMWHVVAYDCGRYWNGVAGGTSSGDGNGIKMGGGDSDCGDNHVVGALALNNRVNGVAHNEAANTTGTDPNIVAAFVTAYGNGGIGADLGGDQTNHKNVLRDTILAANGTARYVGANALERRTTSTLGIGTPGFENVAGNDFSLSASSACLGDGIQEGVTNSIATQPTTGTADNLGASITALRMWKYWSTQDLT